MIMVRDKLFYKTLFTIALPAAFQSVVSFMMGTMDTIMVGQLGEEALAGVAISNQVNAFLFSLLTGLASGSAVLISQYWGKRDTSTIKRIFSLIFLVCCGAGAAANIVALAVPRGVLGLMTGEKAIIDAALPYFTTICFSYILYAANTSLAVMLRTVEAVMGALFTSIICSSLDIFLNWVFIFGNLGMPAMGVRGAAMTTVVSRSLELVIIMTYAFRMQKKLPIKFFDLFKPKLKIAIDYVKHGLPVAIGDSQWAFFGVVKAAVIGHVGTIMVSANAISDTIMSLGFISSSSLAAGACVVVGKAVGAGDYKKAREYSNSIQVIYAVMAVIMASLVYLLRIPIANLFVVSDDVRSYAIQMIAIGAFTLLGTLYHAACFVGINRGSGDGRFVVKVDIICGWFIVLPLLFCSAHVWHLSFPLIYLASRFDQCFKWIIAFIRLKGDKWIKNVTA